MRIPTESHAADEKIVRTESPGSALDKTAIPQRDILRVAAIQVLSCATRRIPGEQPAIPMRDDYLQNALKVVGDPTILVNVISRRVKQLRRGNRPLVESLEKLSAEDTALREVAEGKISYELATPEELARL